jgi:ABC-type Mn/Zn transport systems, ATPase component
MNKLAELSHIDAGYGQDLVLRNVSLTIYEKDYLGVIGPNGGGKTTLLKILLGLLKPINGDVSFFDPQLLSRIGYMPQTNTIDKKFPILVSEVVASGLMSEKEIGKKEIKIRTEEVLEQMGVASLGKKPIGELSGGQLQRVLLGRAIINHPLLLILDEPSSYVDKKFESHFYEILQTLNNKTAIVLVSHDIGTVVSNVKNIACVNETLHYHAGSDIDGEWIESHLGCPFEIVGHGNVPHRILKKH